MILGQRVTCKSSVSFSHCSDDSASICSSNSENFSALPVSISGSSWRVVSGAIYFGHVVTLSRWLHHQSPGLNRAYCVECGVGLQVPVSQSLCGKSGHFFGKVL